MNKADLLKIIRLLMSRIYGLQVQSTAIQLLVQSKNVFTHEEYLAMVHHAHGMAALQKVAAAIAAITEDSGVDQVLEMLETQPQ